MIDQMANRIHLNTFHVIESDVKNRSTREIVRKRLHQKSDPDHVHLKQNLQYLASDRSTKDLKYHNHRNLPFYELNQETRLDHSNLDRRHGETIDAKWHHRKNWVQMGRPIEELWALHSGQLLFERVPLGPK
jgi:hypothetical protein